MDMTALVRSSRPAAASRNSGSNRRPLTNSSSMTGTPSRKTAPHQKNCRMMPPTSGPIALPTMKPVIQTVIAKVRSRSTWNMFRISDKVEGISVAPATPSNARVAISMPAVVEKAASTEATPKAAAPVSNSRRRPMRSPSVPMVMRKPAIMKP